MPHRCEKNPLPALIFVVKYVLIPRKSEKNEGVSKYDMPSFHNMLKNIKQSLNFLKLGLCHVKKF
jgi:hypothetical protein